MRIRIATALLFIFAITPAAFPETPEEIGARLMKKNDDRPVFEKLKATGTLVIYNSSGDIRFKKIIKIGVYTTNMGTPQFCEKYIASFISPPDDKGNSFLMYHYKSQPDVKWVYLKGIRKAKKVTGADKKLSFFGSDFTNGETGKPNYLEWTYKYLGDEQVKFKGKNFDCYKIEALPKNRSIMSEYGTGRMVSYLEKKTLLTLQRDHYDENMIKVKELRLLSFFTKPNVKGENVMYETGIEMKNVNTGTKSHLLFSAIETEGKANLRTDIFTEQYLTQKWW
ncbi:MAG: outer membrane lipoprotein-sorting protein [Spirochaetes bacterium]|nr:outer membrane lipoprotein-sorting protein [Spirochaetota bacterium]